MDFNQMTTRQLRQAKILYLIEDRRKLRDPEYIRNHAETFNMTEEETQAIMERAADRQKGKLDQLQLKEQKLKNSNTTSSK